MSVRSITIPGVLAAAICVGGTGVAVAPLAAASAPCANGLAALTFDDGPVTADTEPLLDILASHDVRATFFVIGQRLLSAENTATARRAARLGHRLENHTWSHPDLTQLTAAETTAEFTRTTDAMVAAGLERPTLQRPPYGATSDAVASAGEQAGLTQVLWNVDTRDYENPSPDLIRQRVRDGLRPNSTNVVLMHAAYTSNTATALPFVIEDVRAAGYCFAFMEPTDRVEAGVGKIRLIASQEPPPSQTPTATPAPTVSPEPTTPPSPTASPVTPEPSTSPVVPEPTAPPSVPTSSTVPQPPPAPGPPTAPAPPVVPVLPTVPGPPPSTRPSTPPVSVAPQITSDRTLVDVGQAHRLTVTGRAGAAVQLFADGALLRTATTSAGGVSRWDLRLAQRTRYHATVDGVPTRTVTVQARRTVSIGISHADGSYTFSGRVTSPQAGVQVTLARLDSRTKQVTGVVSTRTTVDGHYEVRTSLPAGFAGYYALTGAHAGLEAGRSRLYGLTVHAVPRSASR